jgi:hypothetical protein
LRKDLQHIQHEIGNLTPHNPVKYRAEAGLQAQLASKRTSVRLLMPRGAFFLKKSPTGDVERPDAI